MQNNIVKTIAWFTANDSNSGLLSRSSYLTKIIVPALIKQGIDVDLYSDITSNFYIDDKLSLPVKHYLTAGDYHQDKNYSLFFHQVEEGKQYHFLRALIGLYPGITFFHDLYLSDLGPDPLTNSPWSWVSSKLYSQEFLQHIDWPDRLKEFPRVGPFPQREVSLSVATISPTVRFCDDISRSEYAKGKKNFFCPYPIDPKIIRAACNEENRATQSANQLKIAIFGSANIEDRVHKLFLALRNVNKKVCVNWMLPASSVQIASARAEEFNIKCQFVTDVSCESWFKIVSESDIATLTRFSAFGSLSPYLDVALLASKPVIVTDFGDADYYPNNIVSKIQMGSFEANKIAKLINDLSTKDPVSNSQGRSFVLENNQLDQVLHNLICVFNATYQAQQNTNLRWNELVKNASIEFDQVIFQKEYRELGW